MYIYICIIIFDIKAEFTVNIDFIPTGQDYDFPNKEKSKITSMDNLDYLIPTHNVLVLLYLVFLKSMILSSDDSVILFSYNILHQKFKFCYPSPTLPPSKKKKIN